MMFPTQSGRTNLRLLGKTQGIGLSAVNEALERVGLADRADDLAKNYSLGMRQRLARAARAPAASRLPFATLPRRLCSISPRTVSTPPLSARSASSSGLSAPRAGP